MKLEIKIVNVSIQELAKLELLFPEELHVFKLNKEDQAFDAELNLGGTLNSSMPADDFLEVLKTALNDYRNEKVEDGSVGADNILYHSVEELEISVRSAHCLKMAEIKLIGELASKTESEMLRIQNFGHRTLNELRDVLADKSLTFGMKFNNFPDPVIVKKLYG